MLSYTTTNSIITDMIEKIYGVKLLESTGIRTDGMLLGRWVLKGDRAPL